MDIRGLALCDMIPLAWKPWIRWISLPVDGDGTLGDRKSRIFPTRKSLFPLKCFESSVHRTSCGDSSDASAMPTWMSI